MNNTPQMSGTAEAPKSFKVSTTVRYVITQTDMDTWRFPYPPPNGSVGQMFDTACDITPSRIASMSSGSYTLRGVNGATGTYTWDITGIAVSTPAIYEDVWVLKNNRSQLDVLLDLSLTVTQQITITAQ